ncbi:tRNA 2-thiouridine(34) synthase MnmA [Patescibacteria group bacterium]|nr:tRNA 2-thiouridine(34) synthase MnmA [Patescibacteria group bacterium]
MVIKQKKSKLKVFVGMSGGVDSSVAAAVLKKDGYSVIGVHLKCFNLDGCADRDLEDARRAAEVLGIPFYVFDFEKEYKKNVMKYMIDGYRDGITPNPDVMCNKEIKFGLFLDKALEMGADYVATGHYVDLKPNFQFPISNFQKKSKFKALKNRKLTTSYSLFIAKDKNKDQSYFLWTLTQKQLKHCLFPLGDLKKPEVRKIAQKFKLLNANKKDSQGICFLGKIGLEDFLKKYIKSKKGKIVDTEGNELGEHDGVYYYTLGQRHGLHLCKTAKTPDNKPYYVADKILKTNRIIVAQGKNNPALFKKEINLINVSLINPASTISLIRANGRMKVLARVRYRQPLFGAELFITNVKKNNYKMVFDSPQKFIAKGQSVVFYERSPSTSLGLKMLGGGIIN